MIHVQTPLASNIVRYFPNNILDNIWIICWIDLTGQKRAKTVEILVR